MPLALYGHPFSAFCQKVRIALYENELPFEYRIIRPDAPEVAAAWASLWPLRRMPVLVDDGEVVAESSIIIEHLQLRHPGPMRLLPEASEEALEVRFLDRFFDHHVAAPMQQPVHEALRPDGGRRQEALASSAASLDAAYGWLEARLRGRRWAAGDGFSMADCAAAPALFYADWVHPIGEAFPTLRGYRARLLGRPSFARAVAEARPYRPLFPLGAPDRD